MSHQLAEAKFQFAEASARHQVALDKALTIDNLIQSAAAKQGEITDRRLAGIATAADTAEFAALVGDLEVLRPMLVEAQSAVRATAPTKAANQLAMAERHAEREVLQAEFDALAEQAAKLDAALCDCVHLLHQRGQALGRRMLSQSWRLSERLEKAFRLGVAP